MSPEVALATLVLAPFVVGLLAGGLVGFVMGERSADKWHWEFDSTGGEDLEDVEERYPYGVVPASHLRAVEPVE